jgi:hypothetical protein
MQRINGKSPGYRPGWSARAVAAVAAGALLHVLAPPVVSGEETRSAEAPGMRVYVNPETGALEEPTLPQSPRPRRRSGAPVGPPPTPPVEIPAPDGNGVMIDGRPFRAEMQTEIGPDGKPLTHCDEPAADSGREE